MGARKQLEGATYEDGADSGDGSSRSRGFTVRRERLLRDLETKGRAAGISVLCAPDGFGKTALLLQYASEVRDDAARGMVQLIIAGELGADELLRELRDAEDNLEVRRHPLIVIDDMPVLGSEGVEVIVAFLRKLHANGFELAISCKPNNRLFVHALGDSYKVSAQTLKVNPREYSEWVRLFSIASELDMYDLTQGVPSLVVMLREATRRRRAEEGLAGGIVDLYRGVLVDLRKDRDPLYRLTCLFILLGRGSIADLSRCGMRLRSEMLARLSRDYPIFGFDAESHTFKVLGGDTAALDRLRKDIARRRPAFALKAVRTLIDVGHIDRAVHLAGLLLDTEGCLEVINYNPASFALSGNALFVHTTVTNLTGEGLLALPLGVQLALHLAALTMGEYRLARSACREIRRRAAEIPETIRPDVWLAAAALSELWADCSNVELPHVASEYTKGAKSDAAQRLRLHRRAYCKLIAGDGVLDAATLSEDAGPVEEEMDVPRLFIVCDRCLDSALHGELANAGETIGCLEELAKKLSARRLTPLVARVRMTIATCRVLSGLPLVDERAFTDAGTVAIRESDNATQLYCLLGEGWQSLDVGQVVNARFRAQQVLKLADERWMFLRDWATILERVAFILNTSKVGVCDEAELLDLTQRTYEPVEAWSVALILSAAHFDAELSAWYSIHKAVLLEARFCPVARLALAAIGERANSLRRLLPARMATRYLLGNESPAQAHALFEPEVMRDRIDIGQVNINLFGGFSVQRNGHTLTNEVWRRKKASVLAARLALSPGVFVGRQVIMEEMWPDVEFTKARDNLYAAVSALRTAFGQQANGPQYVLIQGDGIALNTEYVCADIMRFDMLAREILLKRTGTSARQIIESCLKLEQLYVGPLYVSDVGNPAFFVRMRRSYLSKFVDCMLRGVETAIEVDDLPSASWLIEAALQQAPLREDVLRCAMRIYDRAGRRREVVELYNSHLHYLRHELKMLPEEETRLAYESIVGKAELRAIM